MVHEASSTFMGEESGGGSVDGMYRAYGANNVVFLFVSDCRLEGYVY